MMNTLPAALTIGEIARQLDAPLHKIEYIIKSRNIQPTQRAGNSRVFSQASVDYIVSELRRINTGRDNW